MSASFVPFRLTYQITTQIELLVIEADPVWTIGTMPESRWVESLRPGTAVSSRIPSARLSIGGKLLKEPRGTGGQDVVGIKLARVEYL
jgi:hypothetical protein